VADFAIFEFALGVQSQISDAMLPDKTWIKVAPHPFTGGLWAEIAPAQENGER